MAQHPKSHTAVGKSMLDPLPWFLYKAGDRFKEFKTLIEAGNFFAVIDAYRLAGKLGQQPKWLRGLARKKFTELIVGHGKAAQWHKVANKYRRAMKHFDRWQAVRLLASQGTPWSDIYADASKLLKKTTAAGSELAVEESFYLVNKHQKDPKKRYMYYPMTVGTRKLASIPRYYSK